MKDEVLMKIIGEEVKLFCELDPSLEQFLTKEKNKVVCLYFKQLITRYWPRC